MQNIKKTVQIKFHFLENFVSLAQGPLLRQIKFHFFGKFD